MGDHMKPVLEKKILEVKFSYFQIGGIIESKTENVLKVPIAANWKDVCLQNASKAHVYHLKIW